MFFVKVSNSDWAVGHKDAGDGDADELFITFAVGVEGGMVCFVSYYLFLDLWDEIKFVLGVVVADIHEEFFVEECLGDMVAGKVCFLAINLDFYYSRVEADVVLVVEFVFNNQLYFDSFHVWSEVAVHLVTAHVRWVHAMNESNGCRVQGRV